MQQEESVDGLGAEKPVDELGAKESVDVLAVNQADEALSADEVVVELDDPLSATDESPGEAELDEPELAEPEWEEPELTGFAALGLGPRLVSTLDSLGYAEPTPIQAEAIPHLITGVDLLGQAATGTGKTAAFALPAVERMVTGGKPVVQVLVLTPTRELAMQVSDAVTSYGAKSGVKVTSVYGGSPIGRQFEALRRGVHVVVGTPGRAIDHIKRGSLNLDQLRTVVLDEADEMLDMGFAEDIEFILDSTPEDRQTVMFSATLPGRIHAIAKRHQQDPVQIKIAAAAAAEQRDLIDQQVYVVHKANKASALGRILDLENPTSTLVFCRTRNDVDELTVTMSGRGYRAEALHGGMDQAQRDRVMARLRDGTAELLIATDVAARGLDVDSLTHVVNYDIPTAPESYVHRIGRVGRAGRRGVAITLASPRQRRLLTNIERQTKQKIKVHKVPTAADLRQRQIETTVEALREALTSEDLDDFQPVLHALKAEATDRDVALAALLLAHQARNAGVDESDIPDASSEFGNDRNDRGGKGHRGQKGYQGKKGSFNGKGPKGSFNGKGSKGKGGRPSSGDPDTGFVYVGVGSQGGVRPGDLVGAIANESGLSGKDIGPIRISDHYSVVGVPEGAVDEVVQAIKKSTVKGKKAKARRFVD